MSELLPDLAIQARGLIGLEGVAVVAAVAYLVLAIRQHISCWYFAGLSSALYVYILFDARLYMESVLSVFYFAMAVYGWFSWSRRGSAEPLAVTTWAPRTHTIALATVALLSATTGYLLSSQTDAAFPYVDSLTTWAALWATFLVARKVLENWWYWLAIDLTLIVVFSLRELELTALLYLLYVLMIPFGFLSWRRSWLNRQATLA